MEISRPATLEDVKKLARALNENGAQYLLIGGYALFVHGLHRATEDIDVLVPATAEAGEKVRQALLVLPDRAAAEIDPAWFAEAGNIRIADEIVVDLMQNAGGETYETLSQYAEVIDIDGVPVRTLNLEGLLRTKRRSERGKDAEDKARLIAALAALAARGASDPGTR